MRAILLASATAHTPGAHAGYHAAGFSNKNAWPNLLTELRLKSAHVHRKSTMFLLPRCRTALTVCHALSIAITVVLPAPVANFSASRINSGLASLLAAAR